MIRWSSTRISKSWAALTIFFVNSISATGLFDARRMIVRYYNSRGQSFELYGKEYSQIDDSPCQPTCECLISALDPIGIVQ